MLCIDIKDRRHETYEAIFRCLKKQAVNIEMDLKPKTIICDFEQVVINAVGQEVYVSFRSPISPKSILILTCF